MVAFPAPAGVNTPAAEMVPFVAVHVTALLKFPVPDTAAVHIAVWPGRIDTGLQVTVTDEIAEAGLIATFTLAALLGSCVEAAVMTAVPALDGVNSPAGVIVPFVAVQVTDWL